MLDSCNEKDLVKIEYEIRLCSNCTLDNLTNDSIVVIEKEQRLLNPISLRIGEKGKVEPFEDVIEF